jgi:hypothetical protein
MGFRYQLATQDGNVFGEAAYGFQPQPGDEVYVDGARRMRVTAVVPHERIGEFLDKPVCGLLEVEPIDS